MLKNKQIYLNNDVQQFASVAEQLQQKIGDQTPYQ